MITTASETGASGGTQIGLGVITSRTADVSGFTPFAITRVMSSRSVRMPIRMSGGSMTSTLPTLARVITCAASRIVACGGTLSTCLFAIDWKTVRSAMTASFLISIDSTQRGVQLVQRRSAGTEVRRFQRIQRLAARIQRRMQIGRKWIDVQQSGDDLAARVALLHVADRCGAIRRVVVCVEAPQPEHGAVMLAHVDDFAGRVFGRDLVARRDEVDAAHRLVVFAYVVVALRAAGVVGERDAGADHVDESRAAVRDRALDERHQLRLVARKAAAHIRGPQFEREADEVDGAVAVHDAFLALAALVRRRGELALGEAVHAVVLADVCFVF